MQRLSRLVRWLESIGYDRRSLVAASIMGAVCLSVAINWRHLVAWDAGVDWLLTVIWAFMGALLLWKVRPLYDAKLVFVGLLGGFLIEWWGTETLLWRYFTRERPPLWILPAWPIAALTIDRLTRVVVGFVPALQTRAAPAYWLVMPAFVVYMGIFIWPTAHIPATQVVLGLMVFVTLWRARPGPDLALFVCGAALGIFLEYWGTSRRCWVYYTREVPPLEAVLAHGFASVAFARGVQGLELALGLLGLRGGGLPEERREVA